MNRVHSIDYLKAVGIVAVVFGHSDIPDLAGKWIYSFHIPLFFLVAGALVSPSTLEAGFLHFVKARLRPLIYAYLIFAVIGIFFFTLIRFLGSEPLRAGILQKALGVLYGSGTIGEPLRLFPVSLWFFPALVSGFVVFFLIATLPKAFRPLAAIGSLEIGFLLGSAALPWEIESGLCAAPLLYLGHALAPYLRFRLSPQLSLPAGILLLLLGAWLTSVNMGFDFRASLFGNPLLSCPSFMFSIIGLFLIAKDCPKSMLVEKISNATLVIFPLHQLLLWISDSIAKRAVDVPFLSNSVYVITKCVMAIGVLVVAAPYLNTLLRLKKRPNSSVGIPIEHSSSPFRPI